MKSPQELYRECEALHERLKGELSHWDGLCQQYIDVCTSMQQRKDSMDECLEEGTKLLSLLHERVQQQNADDWWKSAGDE